MKNDEIIALTEEYVRKEMTGAEGGHDWWHTDRVRNLAVQINKREKADSFIVELGALLHDIADSKFHGGDESVGPAAAGTFLESLGVDAKTIEHIKNIITHISFKGGGEQLFRSPELDIIQDADRLDALGAVGIARTFNYGGFKNREIYNPSIPPNLQMSREEYKNSTAPTINHFYEKLLLLKDRMNTETGRKMARHRHDFLETFLDEFFREWEGEL
ncbi:MAG: HD domain-containing protein [Spirochaetales bacterium]|nr:HD domain-containing protein [Spirochaetales bacterium]